MALFDNTKLFHITVGGVTADRRQFAAVYTLEKFGVTGSTVEALAKTDLEEGDTNDRERILRGTSTQLPVLYGVLDGNNNFTDNFFIASHILQGPELEQALIGTPPTSLGQLASMHIVAKGVLRGQTVIPLAEFYKLDGSNESPRLILSDQAQAIGLTKATEIEAICQDSARTILNQGQKLSVVMQSAAAYYMSLRQFNDAAKQRRG
jgi:hypothetical protein